MSNQNTQDNLESTEYPLGQISEYEPLRGVTDIRAMHALITEFLNDLGLPVELIQEEVLVFRRDVNKRI
jgi:hypothetical protein